MLGIVGIACLRYIVKNEKDKKYPVERYWDEQEEKQQNTSGDDTQTDCDAEEKDVTHSVTIDNITYEFVDCDMIEDTEIEMQSVKMSTLYELRLIFTQGEKKEYTTEEIVELLDKIETAKDQK